MKGKSKIKIFCDSSALIAGLKSPGGSMRRIINLSFKGHFILIISEQVKRETVENIYKKFPEAIWIMKMIMPDLKRMSDPNVRQMQNFSNLINQDDLPILTAAINSNPDYLLTWNTKHFITKKIKKSVNFIVCTPADFLQKYWKKNN